MRTDIGLVKVIDQISQHVIVNQSVRSKVPGVYHYTAEWVLSLQMAQLARAPAKASGCVVWEVRGSKPGRVKPKTF